MSLASPQGSTVLSSSSVSPQLESILFTSPGPHGSFITCIEQSTYLFFLLPSRAVSIWKRRIASCLSLLFSHQCVTWPLTSAEWLWYSCWRFRVSSLESQCTELCLWMWWPISTHTAVWIPVFLVSWRLCQNNCKRSDGRHWTPCPALSKISL